MKMKINANGYEGYLAGAEGCSAGVLVVQEIYGVNREVRRVTDHFASAGYLALAPDIMWRSKPWLDFGYEERDAARNVILKLDYKTLVDDLVEAIEVLRSRLTGSKKIAIVGLGWGGKPAIEAATRAHADCSVSFYPGTLDEKSLGVVSSCKAPMQFHFASKDERTPEAFRSALAAALNGRSDAEVHVYEGAEHGFANHDRPECDRAAADLAERRQDDFVKRHCGGTK
jgi:carboxymethylenebutenolidase